MGDTITLEVCCPGKEPSSFPIDAGVYSVGREDDCKIRLSHDDVEKRHAVLTVRPDACWIEDLDAVTGTRVDGVQIHGRVAVAPGQSIGIGPFELHISLPSPCAVQKEVNGTTPPVPPPAPPEPEEQEPAPKSVLQARRNLMTAERKELPPEVVQKRSIMQQIHKELVDRMDIKRLSASRIGQQELRDRALSTIRDIVKDVADRIPPHIEPAQLVKELHDEALGLGPLEDLLADETITEVMVNGHDEVYIERAGQLKKTDCTFMDDDSVLAIIERIVAPIGRRIDESQPYVDARLPDGSRVNAIIHPLSLIGPCITIRKFSKRPFTDADLMRFGTFPPEVAEFAQLCVLLRKNVIISGGTGSGKTTLLNVFGNYLPNSDRIVTIEDAAELRLTKEHLVRLEARPPNIEGKGAVTIRDLVRNSLRMRPDRIVVGECRGGEALDMLQAMNTGHDGSLTTVHANSPRDVISRLETMVLMSGMDLPVRAIREQVAAAIDLIVHEQRFSDGSRKVTKVTEIVGLEGEQITMQDIFEFVQTGVDDEGKVIGHFRPTGAVPTFVEDVRSRGLTINQSMFDPQAWGTTEQELNG